MEFDRMEIGKEQMSLAPARVKITAIEERDVDKFGKKLVLKVLHPGRADVEIGAARFENNGKLSTSGLWLKKDQENKLQGNSAVAYLLRFLKCLNISQLIGKEVDTVSDDKGYLVAKAY
jgi:hypothetical protein